MKTLETPRLILRDWQLTDVGDLYAYASHPEVGPGAGWKPHESPEESLGIMKEVFMAAGDCWAIVLKETGQVMGSLGLHKDPLRTALEDCRMLGYVLARPLWGRGLMTEAAQAAVRCGFEDMGLSMISVYHYPRNGASGRVIEKCGFVYEGTLRRACKIWDGSLQDSLCYSLTREEYSRCGYASAGGEDTIA